jgi:hypothetical protein
VGQTQFYVPDARKIVQIATIVAADLEPAIFALCDDGTLWKRDLDEPGAPWEQVRGPVGTVEAWGGPADPV